MFLQLVERYPVDPLAIDGRDFPGLPERPLPLAIEGGTVACHAIEEGRLPIEDRSYAGAAS